MSVQTKIENYLNYITGSGGGWPSDTNVGIVAGVDYIIESGSDNIYFHEMNTACGVYGSYSAQSIVFNKISDYANEQGCTTAYVYGQDDSRKRNPSSIQEPLISSSFARHNISCSFEYGDDTGRTYFSQRGSSDHVDKFHLWMQSPWFSDDNLLEIVSGSFNKNTFRTILSSSPVSSSLTPLFDTGSFTTSNPYHPDFVVKDASKDGTAHQSTGLEFYKYNSSNPTYQNAVNSGSLIETFIVPSGSIVGGIGYASTRKMNYLMTPNKQILLEDKDELPLVVAPKFVLMSGKDKWTHANQMMYSSASGSLIDMYDGSTKQVQDIEVGDVVKSYKPVGLPDESYTYDWLDYSTTDLSGSVASGSVVMRTMEYDHYGHILVNGSIKIAIMNQSMMKGARYFLKQGDTWTFAKPDEISVGDYLFNKDGNEVEITSVSEVGENLTWYSLDVEDIDTYFTSEILVHNIPPRKCFTGDTMITLADGTYHKIKHIELGAKIKTYDEETGKLKDSVVLEVVKVLHDNLVKYKFDDNTEIKATDDHPFYTDGDYRPLEVGDEVLNDELNKIKVVSVEKVDGLIETYNINKTNNSKNYFANRVLVSDESDT
jgi:intein/homing endonuclease